MSGVGIIDRAKVWAYGDDIDTDVLAPGLYMKSPLEEMAKHRQPSIDMDCSEQVAKNHRMQNRNSQG